MSILLPDPARPPIAPPSDLPTAAQHARYADDGRDALDDALASTRLADAFKAGRMTDSQARRVIERIIAVGRLDVADITRRLVDGLATGLSTLGGWFRSMVKAIVPRHYAASYAALRSAVPGPADLAEIRSRADGQVGYLARFRRNLQSGLQRLDGSAASRSQQYADAAWGLAIGVEAAGMLREGYGYAWRVLGGPVEHHCPECPALARAGWVAMESTEFKPIGSTVCRIRCRCHLKYGHIDPSTGRIVERAA